MMDDFIEGVLWGAVIMFVIGAEILFVFYISDPDRVQELGQSICHQEYNMDFDSYKDKQLKCKPKEIRAQVQYDGIVVQIK